MQREGPALVTQYCPQWKHLSPTSVWSTRGRSSSKARATRARERARLPPHHLCLTRARKTRRRLIAPLWRGQRYRASHGMLAVSLCCECADKTRYVAVAETWAGRRRSGGQKPRERPLQRRPRRRLLLRLSLPPSSRSPRPLLSIPVCLLDCLRLWRPTRSLAPRRRTGDAAI